MASPWSPLTDELESYRFTPKHQFSVKNHILSGITLPALLRILWRHRADVGWLAYAPRLLFLLLMSCLTSLLGLIEWVAFGRAVAAQQLHPSPVFVLGHPRTGTTLLHNLLALDDDRFAFANTLQCGFPSAFLLLDALGLRGAMGAMVDDVRPMDNVALSLDTPQEDELATNVLSGGASPYMPLIAMRGAAERYWGAFTFAPAPGRAPAGARWAAWREAFLLFLRKVTLSAERQQHRGGGGGGGGGGNGGGVPSRRLLLKSPVHTARIRLLLQLFPAAQFVYIHRDPAVVFASACHMADTTYWYTYLARPTDKQVSEFVLNQFELLHEEYVAARGLVPEGSLVELGFAELEGGPVAALERVYGALGWEMSARARARMRAHVEGLRGFRKNSHRQLSAVHQRLVWRRWRRAFDEFGYPRPPAAFADDGEDDGEASSSN
jgi:hypothetical protein